MDAVAEKLKAFLGREYDLQAGVRDDIDFLRSKLKGMHAFLQRYASCETTTTLVKHRAWEVQELAYDVEDAVDEFTYRVGPAPAGIPVQAFKHFVSSLMARRQIAHKVRSLRDQLKVEERKWSDDLPLTDPAPSGPPSSSYADTTDLVGIDGPRDEIIAKLTVAGTEYGSGRRRVACMVGFAGVGKTTLARAVYDSLGARFQCQAFVTVSRRFEIRRVRVLKEILQKVRGKSSTPDPATGSSSETWEELRDELKDYLKDKRYLIVVDDLWEKSAWEHISCALPENTLDSIIITTTRNESVANACCLSYRPGHFMYKVKPLNYLDSRTLFFGHVFGSDDKCPHLKEVSAKILKKCAGLPLAIVCISSLLATKGQESAKWEKVYNSLGYEMESNESLHGLKQALKVGYDDLPPRLKICLLYLSAFPEDCKIGRDRLTRRWVAEGFVDERPDMSMQDVAEDYFNKLIERGMIQAVDVDCLGEIHACRIHDVILDLITLMSFEENFLTLISDRHGATKRHHARRISLGCGTATDGLDWSNFNMSRVRSLSVYGNIDNIDFVPLCRFLRMLDFECCEGLSSRQLKNIGEAILLKYLSFKSTWISELPPQIGELRCLETLDLTQTNIRELPVEVTRLQRLLHLLAGGAELPQGIGNMRSLEILRIRASCKRSKEAVKELVRITSLRKLDMSYVGRKNYKGASPDTLPSIISKLGKHNLQSLHFKLEGYSIGLFLQILNLVTSPPDRLQSLRIRGDYGFHKVPAWIGSLIRLTDLELTVKMLYKQDLEILAGLSGLVRFLLTLKEPSREGITIPGSWFPCLKELFISCRIMPVSISQGVIPKLEKFELQFKAYQEDFKYICPRIEHLQSLKGFQHIIIVRGGLSRHEVEHLKNTFKNAVFIWSP